jgi:phosphatidylethanolamine-binding protein (PEBP) family uncharacterized protein
MPVCSLLQQRLLRQHDLGSIARESPAARERSGIRRKSEEKLLTQRGYSGIVPPDGHKP